MRSPSDMRYLCTSALATVAAGVAAPASAQQVQPTFGRDYTVTLPLLFDGAYQGDIATTIAMDGVVKVDAARVLALLGERVDRSVSDAIRLNADAQGLIGLDQLVEFGINASYDPATLELKFSIPVARQGSQMVSVLPARTVIRGSALEPSDVSASAILSVSQTYVWSSRSAATGFRPANFSADVAANVGGAGGVSLFGQLEYDASAARAFRRGNFQLIHDDEQRAIRYAAGDIAPGTAGYQTSPLLGGIAIERQYGAIQPLRSIRPSGQYSFQLDREATVDVVVNGATLRTLQLKPGQYNLRDFPFFNGLNQVELYVVDSAGRRLLANFSQYYSARLIDRGIFEFGATAGVLQRSAAGSSRYDWDTPVFSGYARYGLTSGFTLGVNAQAAADQWNGGLEAAIATPVGTFGMLAAVSDYRGAGSGTSLLASYEGAFPGGGPFRQVRVNLEAEKTSRRFTAITTSIPYNKNKFRLSARASAVLPGRIGLGLSGTSEFGRDAEPDRHRLAVNVTRNFGRINANASFEREARQGSPADNRFLLSLSVPLGGNRTARGAYDSRQNLTSLEFSQYRRDEIDTFGLRAAITRDDGSLNASGEVDYAGNRFAARVRHRAIGTASGTITGQETEYVISTEIAMAGGKVAIGRPVGPRFAIVERHETLTGTGIDVWQGPIRDRPQARAAKLGPALISLGSAYLPTQIRVDVKGAPAGYDIGPGAYALRPGNATGYAITIGSDASRIVIGTLVDVAGHPLRLLGGSLVPAGKPDAAPILFFTNAGGRFVANGLAAGEYLLRLGPEGRGQAVITVPKSLGDNPSIGQVRVEGLMAPEPGSDATSVTRTQAAPPPAAAGGEALSAGSPPPAAAEPANSEAALSGKAAARHLMSGFGVADEVAGAVCRLAPDETAAVIDGWRAQGSDRLREQLAERGIAVDSSMLEQLFIALVVDHAASLAGGVAA